MAALIASSSNDTGGWGLLIILGVVLLVVLAVGAVWTFAARRGRRMPERSTHPHEPGARGTP